MDFHFAKKKSSNTKPKHDFLSTNAIKAIWGLAPIKGYDSTVVSMKSFFTDLSDWVLWNNEK